MCSNLDAMKLAKVSLRKQNMWHYLEYTNGSISMGKIYSPIVVSTVIAAIVFVTEFGDT